MTVEHELERRSPEYSYPTHPEFDSMTWLKTVQDIFAASDESDSTKTGASADAQDAERHALMTITLQRSYNPRYPLASVTEIPPAKRTGSDKASVWYLTSQGWIRHRIPIPNESVRQQLFDNYSQYNIADFTTDELYNQIDVNELHDRGWAGMDGSLDDDEADAFVARVIDKCWDKHATTSEGVKTSNILIEDNTDPRQVFIDTLYQDEDDVIDPITNSINSIFQAFEQSSLSNEYPHALVFHMNPASVISIDEDTGHTYLAIPEFTSPGRYQSDDDFSIQTGVTYYHITEAGLTKTRIDTTHIPHPMDPKTANQLLSETIAGNDHDPQQLAGDSEAQFVAHFLDQMLGSIKDVREATELIRTTRSTDDPKRVKKEFPLGDRSIMYEQKFHRDAGHTLLAVIREDRDHEERAYRTASRFGNSTMIWIARTNDTNPDNSYSLKITYNHEEGALVVATASTRHTSEELSQDARRTKRYWGAQSARTIMKTNLALPKDSLFYRDEDDVLYNSSIHEKRLKTVIADLS